jgi:hypothetical protein
VRDLVDAYLADHGERAVAACSVATRKKGYEHVLLFEREAGADGMQVSLLPAAEAAYRLNDRGVSPKQLGMYAPVRAGAVRVVMLDGMRATLGEATSEPPARKRSA